MPPAPTRYYEELGHEVRSDPWLMQGRSSYGLALEALTGGLWEDAVALARMTVQEATEARDLFVLWLDQLPALLSERGIERSTLLRASTESGRIKQQLESGWNRYHELIDRFESLACSQRDAEAADVLELARREWLHAHDPAADQLSALLSLAASELGEESVGPLWDALLGHYYRGLAEKYGPEARPWSSSLERLGLDIFEAVRGHLTGAARDGQFEIREEADRWVLQFDPCGSGGRMYETAVAAESVAGHFTTAEHDWAWQTRGVCLYCVHCCQLQQRAPIEEIGFPLRVIEPPVRSSAAHSARPVCTWSIYKDPMKVPAHAYTDVGFDPPSNPPSAHHDSLNG